MEAHENICIPNDIRARRAPHKGGVFGCEFSVGFHLQDLVAQRHPLRCARHVRRESENNQGTKTRTPGPAGKQHDPTHFQDTLVCSFLGSAPWLFFLWWKSPAGACWVTTKFSWKGDEKRTKAEVEARVPLLKSWRCPLYHQLR